MSLTRSPFARAILLALALALALAGSASLWPSAFAQPTTGVYRPFPPASVTLRANAAAVPRDGGFAYTATVNLDAPARYLQVRLRVRRPTGRLLYQRTFVRADAEAGTLAFSFARELEDLDLRPAIYPVELTVVAEGESRQSWTVGDNLRVFDARTPPLPVAVIVRVTSAPAIEPDGRFATDPALETRARDEVRLLADAIIGTPGLRASLAIPAELLEEWQRIADGYEITGAAGVQRVDADASAPRAYGAALVRLRAAVRTGRLELMNVPYADPDVAGLVTAGRLRDLDAHLDRGISTYAATLETTPSAGTYPAHACLIAAAAQRLAGADIGYSVVSADYTRSGDATASPGVYASKRVPLTLLVPDSGIAHTVASGDADAAADALFTLAIASDDARVGGLPLSFEVGPGRPASVAAIVDGLADVLAQPWATLTTAGTAADGAKDDGVALTTRASVSTNTPVGWWEAVGAARVRAAALVSALPAGSTDADAADAWSLVAENASWAGPDGLWSLADRARAFVSATDRAAARVFDPVAIDAQDVTLSGATGSVPLSITNGSDVPLSVVLRVTPNGVRLRGNASRPITLLPAENYLEVPVDLRSSTGGSLKIEVVAGSLVVASKTVRAHASYLDRVVTIALVVFVLGAMLVYIQRRVQGATRPGSGR